MAFTQNVLSCVFQNYIFLWKSFSTIAAFVWHLSCMFLCVMLKISVLQESLITMSAQVWLLPSVYLWMYLKVIFLWEILFHNSYIYVVSPQSPALKKGLVTMPAWVWLLPSVYSQLYLKLIYLWESLFTITTFLWPISCMCPQVMLKIVVLQDCLVSMVA